MAVGMPIHVILLRSESRTYVRRFDRSKYCVGLPVYGRYPVLPVPVSLMRTTCSQNAKKRIQLKFRAAFRLPFSWVFLLLWLTTVVGGLPYTPVVHFVYLDRL